MNRKPDVIRALVVVFTVGLLVSGLTTYAASDRTETRFSSNSSHWEATAIPDSRISYSRY